MSDRLIETLASALPVDPDDGTMPIEYFAIDDRDGFGLVREWSVPETIAEKQIAALRDAGFVVLDTRDEATVHRLRRVIDSHVRADYDLSAMYKRVADARAVLAALAAKGGAS